MLESNRWLRALIILLVFVAAFHLWGLLWGLIARFGDVIFVFLLAWLVALALRPLARALSANQRIPWAISVGIIYLIFFALALSLGFVLVPLLVTQLTELVVALPTWLQQLSQWYIDVQSSLPEQLQPDNLGSVLSARDLISQLQQIGTTAVQNALTVATSLATALLGLVLVLTISFYFTLDGERITGKAVGALPVQYRAEARFVLDSVERSFGGFLRGQLIQALIYASGTAIIMSVAGLSYIVLSTTIAGLAMVIPFVGPVIALVAPLVLAVAQGGPALALGVFVALFVLQQVVFNVIAPKLMSEAVGLHPLLVLLAILVGGKAAGLVGAIFGVPVTAVAVSIVVLVFQHVNPQAQEPSEGDQKTATNPSQANRPGWWSQVRRQARR